jgi:diadenosine tetraphosphate (Ap4A) HIT family hydrolase
MKIYENSLIFIEVHESEIPWLKIFTQELKKEFSHCSREEKNEIFRALDIVEKYMIEYYNPTKINIASFGNMLPHVHWHIMARFENDSYFPEPMWGVKKRESILKLPSFEDFLETIIKKLSDL